MYYGLRRPTACPACGSDRLKRLVWGRPSEEGQVWIDRGTAITAGCTPPPYPPQWRCSGCGHEWKDLTDPDQQRLDEIERRFRERRAAREDPRKVEEP